MIKFEQELFNIICDYCQKDVTHLEYLSDTTGDYCGEDCKVKYRAVKFGSLSTTRRTK